MDGVQECFTGLKNSLADSPWTANSAYGILMISLFVLLAALCCKSLKYAVYLVMTFVFLELGHILAGTQVGVDLPFLQAVFKYDVFVALAQLCVGTPLSDDLIWMQAWLNTVVGTAFGLIWGWISMAVQLCCGAILNVMHALT